MGRDLISTDSILSVAILLSSWPMVNNTLSYAKNSWQYAKSTENLLPNQPVFDAHRHKLIRFYHPNKNPYNHSYTMSWRKSKQLYGSYITTIKTLHSQISKYVVFGKLSTTIVNRKNVWKMTITSSSNKIFLTILPSRN